MASRCRARLTTALLALPLRPRWTALIPTHSHRRLFCAQSGFPCPARQPTPRTEFARMSGTASLYPRSYAHRRTWGPAGTPADFGGKVRSSVLLARVLICFCILFWDCRRAADNRGHWGQAPAQKGYEAYLDMLQQRNRSDHCRRPPDFPRVLVMAIVLLSTQWRTPPCSRIGPIAGACGCSRRRTPLRTNASSERRCTAAPLFPPTAVSPIA